MIKNQGYFCHSRIRNRNTSDYLTGALLCIPHLPVSSTSLALYTIYAQVSCVVQLPSKCTLLTQALNPEVLSGGCISATAVRDMAKYIDQLN